MNGRLFGSSKKYVTALGAGIMAWFAGSSVTLAAGADAESTGVLHFGTIFLMFAIVLIVGKLGNVVEKYGQPAVIGELVAGIALSAAGYYGWGFVDEMASSEIIAFLSSFGAMLLLLSIGLESNIKDLVQVGSSSIKVAVVGVLAPFIAGVFFLGPIFFADKPDMAVLFLGASLVATSVGIPSSVLKSLGLMKTKASRIFLGATVIDDVVGLIILAVVSSLADAEAAGTAGESIVGLIATKTAISIAFLCGAIILGGMLAPRVSRMFSAIHTGIGMKIALVIAFALSLGYLAELAGLEPIIGAFAAGLLLDAVIFKGYADPGAVEDLRAIEFVDKKDRAKVLRVINQHSHSHLEDLVNNLSMIFVPIFFVSIGLQVDFGSLLQPELYVVAIAMSIVAFLAKFIAGFMAEGDINQKMLIGASMAPRGEVGLLFAAVGKGKGVLDDQAFSTIVLVVIITTFVAPMVIQWVARRMQDDKPGQSSAAVKSAAQA